MQIVIPLEGRVRTVTRSSFVAAKRLAESQYTLSGDNFQMTGVTAEQVLILPDTVHEGIVINSAEMRLYYYPKGTNTVIVLPIGIGQLGKDTPINWTTKVERKKAGPTWTPTAKMHAEYRAAGEPLPAVVPAGPDNPMGLYALYIGRLYAIHGTNANFGIGLRVSHGCVRLRNEDIKFLFEKVPHTASDCPS